MSRTVLIVEDDRMHRKIYSAVLKAHQYRPIEIVDPKAILGSAIKAQPAALLIDILLPRTDGRTLIAQLRSDPRTQHIPILAVSASTDPELAAASLAAGADRFRLKPMPLLTLIEDIQALTSCD